MNRFLVYFANELIPFRWPEIDAIVSLFNLSIKWRERTSKPFAIVESACERDMRTLCSRSVLIMSVTELWCEGTSKAALFEDMKSSLLVSRAEYVSSERSFKVTVETFNRKTTLEEKVAKIEEMAFLPFEGPINLKSPDNEFMLFEYYDREQGTHLDDPSECYFGRFVCESRKRYNIHKFSLRQRKFISNTSMDPKLSTIMANVAQVDAGHLVLDPFVGSGSILVGAADMGAIVFGSDIDYKLLHGLSRPSRANVKAREADESLLGNLRQYDLTSAFGDLVLADASRPIFRSSFKFDAVICDPPYGIREASERVGRGRRDAGSKIPESMLERHYPSKVHYHLKDIVDDLLRFSCRAMAKGGRLVFWLPVFRSGKGDVIDPLEPKHECMRLICSCEQSLTRQTSRVMICMQKETDNCTAGDEAGELE